MKSTVWLLGGLALLLAGPLQGDETSLKPARFESPINGYCVAVSIVKDPEVFDGLRSSTNLQTITDRELLERKAVYLLAKPFPIVRFGAGYQGIELFLINGTRKTASFKSCDGRLSIVQEASIAGGPWRPLELLPGSWCGNSYYPVFLEPKKSWRFVAPKYEGETKARLRFRFERKPGDICYSNEFDGSVNLSQFRPRRNADSTVAPTPGIPSPHK